MKSILLLKLLVDVGSINVCNCQEDIHEYTFRGLPGSPKKAEIIVISHQPYIDTYYCKVKDKIYFRKSDVKDGKLQLRWFSGYLEGNNSLRIADFFDNYKLDSLSLFGGEKPRFPSSSATYFKVKRRSSKSDYIIRKKKAIISNWWNDDFKPYNGPIIPVTDIYSN